MERATLLRVRSRRGFTLIELLIVIAIIGMLAALITAAVGKAKQAARKAEARTDIDAIGTGLSAYHSDHGIYPGASDPAEEDVNSFPALYENLCGERPPAGRGGRGAPYVDLRMDDIIIIEDEEAGVYITAPKDDLFDPDVPKYYADPWGEPYVYRENKSKRERKDYMIKRHLYDLWSVGPDSENEAYLGDLEESFDDIGNW